MYVTGLPLRINHSKSATITLSNNFLISWLFSDIHLFLGSLFPIPIWSYHGWPLVLHSNKHRIYFTTNLVTSEISFLSIIEHWMKTYSWMKNNGTYSGFISCLTLMFWPISLLSYTLCEWLTNVASARIQLCSQFNSISTCLARLQYFLTPVSPCFLAVSMSALLIPHLYLQARSTKLDTWATFANAIVSARSSDSFFFLTLSEIITSFLCNYIDMLHIILLNL